MNRLRQRQDTRIAVLRPADMRDVAVETGMRP
jgi:hypothetical protein